jgi:hypothetical protein
LAYLAVSLIGFSELFDRIERSVYVYTLVQWLKINFELVIIEGIDCIEVITSSYLSTAAELTFGFLVSHELHGTTDPTAYKHRVFLPPISPLLRA